MHSIIEPRLKEIFHISTSTPRYIGLLELVPSEFVGCPAKLAILTEHLCPEMAGAFRMMNRHLPPWRRVESMLRKWDLAPLSSKETAERLLRDHDHGSSRSPPALRHGEVPYQGKNPRLAVAATHHPTSPQSSSRRQSSPMHLEPWAHLLPPITIVRPSSAAKAKGETSPGICEQRIV